MRGLVIFLAAAALSFMVLVVLGVVAYIIGVEYYRMVAWVGGFFIVNRIHNYLREEL